MLNLSTGEQLQGRCHVDWQHGEKSGISFKERTLDLKNAYKHLACKSARQSTTDFLDILGIQWSGDEKDKPYEFVFDPLGVRFDLSNMATLAKVVVSNKPSRVSSIIEQLDQVQTDNSLHPALASELHGKLVYTQAQTFGRAAIPAIREIGNRAHEFGKHIELSQRLKLALEFVKEHLRTAVPRTISANDNSRNVSIFTDGSFEKEKAQWGFFVHDASTNERIIAGGTVPDELVQYWIGTVGKQIITQVELLAVLIARRFLGNKCAGRKVIWWIDNDAAKDSFVSGHSDSLGSMSVIYSFYELERLSPSYLWFARVPSYSNVADEPSRGKVKEAASKFGAQIVDVSISQRDIKELIGFSARHKNL